MKKLLWLGNKKYVNDVSLYDVKIKNNIIFAFYSKVQESWLKKGELGYSLRDTGDGLVFKDHHMNKEIFLDYDQAKVLRALFKIEDKDGSDTFNLFTLQK